MENLPTADPLFDRKKTDTVGRGYAEPIWNNGGYILCAYKIC